VANTSPKKQMEKSQGGRRFEPLPSFGLNDLLKQTFGSSIDVVRDIAGERGSRSQIGLAYMLRADHRTPSRTRRSLLWKQALTGLIAR